MVFQDPLSGISTPALHKSCRILRRAPEDSLPWQIPARCSPGPAEFRPFTKSAAALAELPELFLTAGSVHIPDVQSTTLKFLPAQEYALRRLPPLVPGKGLHPGNPDLQEV